jgi:hypothetical protein
VRRLEAAGGRNLRRAARARAPLARCIAAQYAPMSGACRKYYFCCTRSLGRQIPVRTDRFCQRSDILDARSVPSYAGIAGTDLSVCSLEQMFVEFLTSGSVVHLVEPDLFVAERARALYWQDGVLLSGADSLHVASAILDGCTEFLTLDGKIRKQRKFSTAIPLLRKVGVIVIRPSETGNLPNEYRQDDWGAARIIETPG